MLPRLLASGSIAGRQSLAQTATASAWSVRPCSTPAANSATENTIIMVHANEEESSEAFSFERHARERYERVWSERARLPDEWFPMTQGTMYYLSVEEALELGIIDEIRPRPGGSEAP